MGYCFVSIRVMGVEKLCLVSYSLYRDLLIFARSCSELLGATLSLPVASPTGTYSYLLGIARRNSIVASRFPYRDHLLIIARSCSELVGVVLSYSEQKCLSNPSHSKRETVNQVKTSKLKNIVKPVKCVKNFLYKRLRILITPSPA